MADLSKTPATNVLMVCECGRQYWKLTRTQKRCSICGVAKRKAARSKKR